MYSIVVILETLSKTGETHYFLHDLASFYSVCGNSLQTYGAKVDQIKAEIGAAVSQGEIEKALKSKKYKVLTFTHVDTSTGAQSKFSFLVVCTCAQNPHRISRALRCRSNRRDRQESFS